MVFYEFNKPFEFPTYRLNPLEKSKIEHEINTNYIKYNGMEFCVHYSYGLDNKSYKYFFENHGFNDYNFYNRKYNKSRSWAYGKFNTKIKSYS